MKNDVRPDGGSWAGPAVTLYRGSAVITNLVITVIRGAGIAPRYRSPCVRLQYTRLLLLRSRAAHAGMRRE